MKHWLLTALLTLGLTALTHAEDQDPHLMKQKKMVKEQLQARGVRDPKVLAAMLKVPRHLFVPAEDQTWAYEDHPLPIGFDQTISQPYIVALMTELLELKSDQRVLEIGTGSGYQAAILAQIVPEVYTVEIVEELAESARARLSSLGYANIKVRSGDGYQGWPEHAPFDAIIVTAAPPEIPIQLVKQLKEGGRMVIPVGTEFQELYLITKDKGGITKTRVLPVRFVPMIKGPDPQTPAP